MPRDYDYLLIGGGLAGALLADRLRHAGARVMLLNDGTRASASRVAAGLINPVLGPRMSIHPLTGEYLRSAQEYYAALARRTGPEVFHAREISRLFASDEERARWCMRAESPDAAPFLGATQPANQPASPLNAPFGMGAVLGGGYVDTGEVLDRIHAELRAANALLERRVDYAELRVSSSVVACGESRAERLVFCEGWRAQANPWFKHLPLQPAKGEILDLRLDTESSGPLRGKLISAGRWLLHISDQRFRLGATYEWRGLEAAPSEQARESLLDSLRKMLNPCPRYRVIAHQIGVRPASRDKAPMLGTHARHPRLAVFNGFGSRGALLIPYYSELMRDYLCRGQPLPAEVDISRFQLNGG